MALQATTKTKLTKLLNLVRDDFRTSAVFHSSSRRLLNSTDQADVRSITPLDSSGVRDSAATAALDAIIADIAAN
jgi:hypothetical protein